MRSKKRLIILAGSLALSSGASLALAQDDSAVASHVHQNSVDQAQVQAQLIKADDEFANLIGEFERNGLGDDPDVKMLQKVRGVLKLLSEDQMNQVLQLLKQAHESAADQSIQSMLQDAYGRQKDLASKLQQVVISFQQQADLLDLSEQFMRLANQQNDNFKATRRLADQADADRLTDAQKDELSVRRIEQDAIAQEVNAWLDKLTELMNSADAPTAAQLDAAMQQVAPGSMRGSQEAALSALTQGFLYKGGAAEHASYKALREFARLLRPPLPPNEVITASAEELARSIDASTQNDSQLAQSNRPDDAATEALVDKLNDVADNAADVGKDVAQLSPKAAATLADAKRLMSQAVSQTAGKDFKDAANSERQAIGKLALARQQLLDGKSTPPKSQKPTDGDPKEMKPGDHGNPNGPLGNTTGTSLTVGLPARDRDKVRQTQGETFPAAYSEQIQQYLANLSEDSDQKNGGHN